MYIYYIYVNVCKCISMYASICALTNQITLKFLNPLKLKTDYDTGANPPMLCQMGGYGLGGNTGGGGGGGKGNLPQILFHLKIQY